MIKFTKKWSATAKLDWAESSTETPEDDLTQINFTQPWNANAELNFNHHEAVVTPSYALQIDAVSSAPFATGWVSQTYTYNISAVSSQAKSAHHFEQIIQLGIAVELEPITCDGESVNDINVDRSMKLDVDSYASKSTELGLSLCSLFDDTPTLNNELISFIDDGDRLDNYFVSVNEVMKDANIDLVSLVVDGLFVENSVIGYNKRFADINDSLLSVFDRAIDLQNNLISSYTYPPKAYVGLLSNWQYATKMDFEVKGDFYYATKQDKEWSSYYEDAINPTGERPIIIEPPIIEPVVQKVLNFVDLWNNKGELDFLRIELDALIVMNEIDIYHVASNGIKTPVHPLNATLDFDIDSFVWSFSGQLSGESNLSLLTHRARFEINVNGHQLLFTLREFSKANSFANDAYSFTCVTNSQWLGQPYASLHNGVVDNPIGAWQLVAEKFATESFTLNRTQTPEWTLGKDSFSYLNKSAIEIAIQVAEASGAMLQPDKVSDIIHVRPRYKVSPWDWGALTDEQCDHVINADYIDMQSSSDNTTPQLNSMLISGETHGVITEVVKTGTAGDVRGKDVLSSLSQDHNVNAELARNTMANSGEQEVLGLALPLLPPDSTFGLMLPGEIVRVIYPEKTITGLCIANSVPIQSITDVKQSVSLELNNGYN